LIQHHMKQFVSDLRQINGFFRVLWFPQSKIDRHDIAEILLKMALKHKNNPYPNPL